MPCSNAVCLMVDRLRASALGCYGNTWYETPGLDLLASEGFVLDHAITTALDLPALYRAYWCGLHPLRPAEASSGASLPVCARQAGIHTVLVTDEPRVADHPLAGGFDQIERVDAPPADRPAADIGQTAIARLLAVAGQWLERASRQSPDRRFLLWIHARAMAAAWDAPTVLRQSLADQEDPAPGAQVAVPRRAPAGGIEPDERLDYQCAYAGQAIALDRCLAAFWDQLFSSPAIDRTAVALLGARGFPLGEHDRVGDQDESLHGESLHVPWLLRFPDPETALARSQTLVQPADLMPTLARWLGIVATDVCLDGIDLLPIAMGSGDSTPRALLCGTPEGERALRTDQWMLRRPVGGPPQLFVKPDDRWEVNDVADLCEDVVTALSQELGEREAGLRSR